MADAETGNYKLVESEPPVAAGGRWFKAASAILLGTAGLVCAFSAKPSKSALSLPSASVDLDSRSPPVVYMNDFVNMNLPIMPGQVNGGFFDLPGKDLSVGLYRSDAGNSVSYTYRYPEFKYIVEGEWHITDGTGQVVHAKAGDLMYFPMGTKVDFTVVETGLGYYIADARNHNHTSEGLAAAMASNPRMVHFPEIAARSNFQNGKGATREAIACDSKVPGLEMSAGLFSLHPGGPAWTNTYDHEEFILVTAGEFDIEDGTGQSITAQAGDMVYFPTGSQIRARTSTPSQGLWSDLHHVTGDSCGTRGTPMVYYKELVSMNLPAMPGQVNGGFFDLPGKDLSVGLYRVDAGNSVSYTYRYPEFKYIVEGEWHLTDGTGQEVHARAGDLMYFPMGTRVDFTVAETGLGYYIADARNHNHTSEGLAAAMALNPRMVHFREIAERSNTNQAIACDYDRVPGLEMTAGLFSSAWTNTYDHEEFVLVTAGEFDIEDGTGQSVTAQAGDMVYFPTGSQIRASTSTPSQALWSDLRYVAADSCGVGL